MTKLLLAINNKSLIPCTLENLWGAPSNQKPYVQWINDINNLITVYNNSLQTTKSTQELINYTTEQLLKITQDFQNHLLKLQFEDTPITKKIISPNIYQISLKNYPEAVEQNIIGESGISDMKVYKR